MFFKKKSKKRVLVLSLDGVPFTFLQKAFEEGVMPNLKRLSSNGKLFRMNSVIPTISSVAWASFMTGKNPGKHGIFGFVDRIPKPLKIYIPTARNLEGPTLWELVARDGGRAVVINVPMTTPPVENKNIVMVSGFLSTKLEKAVNNSSVMEVLKSLGYIIDVDPWKAKENKDEFLSDLFTALEKRLEAFYAVNKVFGKWDFFMLHIMETDRINHFLWGDWENNREPYSSKFIEFYKRLDQIVGEIVDGVLKHSSVLILSDHGFTGIKHEVYINHWLEANGYLKLVKKPAERLSDMSSETKAYSLIPGRIFVNLKGREEIGSVEFSQYEELREELISALKELRDPETGEDVIDRVFKKEEIYSGSKLGDAADLIIHPKYGYDFKGNMNVDKLFSNSHIQGMHTYDDAFALFLNFDVNKEPTSIIDMMPTILTHMGVDYPNDVDGRSLL